MAKEFEFKDQFKDIPYEELLKMENVLTNKILVNSLLGMGSKISGSKITGEVQVVAGVLQSANYVIGTSGWRLTPTSAELINVTVTGYLLAIGGAYASAAAGARVLIFPDANTGLQIIDNAGNDVLKALIGGANVGDVIIGNYAGNQGLKYDKSAGVMYYKNLQWSAVTDDDGHKPADDATKVDDADDVPETVGKKWAGETGADITGNHIANDADNLNSRDSELVQTRAEYNYIKGFFNGYYNDGLTESVSSGTITRRLIDTYLNIPANSGDYAKLHSSNSVGDWLVSDWDSDYEFVAKLSTSAPVADVAPDKMGSTIFFGLLDGTVFFANTYGDNGIVLVTRHIGFFVSKDGGVYASNANGTNQTSTLLAGVSYGTVQTYKIIIDAGTNIKFYVDDVLKATHTTNLPSGATNPPDFTIYIRKPYGSMPGDAAIWVKTYNNYKVIAL